MTRPRTDLLASFAAENVRPVSPERQTALAERLVSEFTAFAKDAGLDSDDLGEIEEEIGERLVDYFEEAIEAARSAAR